MHQLGVTTAVHQPTNQNASYSKDLQTLEMGWTMAVVVGHYQRNCLFCGLVLFWLLVLSSYSMKSFMVSVFLIDYMYHPYIHCTSSKSSHLVNAIFSMISNCFCREMIFSVFETVNPLSSILLCFSGKDERGRKNEEIGSWYICH